MKMLFLLSRLSAQYWMKHKKRFLSIFFTVLIGSAALNSVALLIRSEKNAVLEEELVILGNYDIIIYETNQEVYDRLSQLESVEAIGCYYELGYGAGADDESMYKIAAYKDDISEELYHMTCIRGSYPEKADEVALDISVAKALGVAPYPGTQITLNLYDSNSQPIGEETYTISGIYEATDSEVSGGWLRYPFQLDTFEGYTLPGIFLHSDAVEPFAYSRMTLFAQTSVKAGAELEEEIFGWGLDSELNYNRIEVPSGRTYAYTYVLGIFLTIEQDYGERSLTTLSQALKDGNVIQDFYTAVLIPIFSVLIFIVVFLAVYTLVRNVIWDRVEQIGILRSLGLKKSTCNFWLFFEFMLIVLVISMIGLAAGSSIHAGMIMLVNDWLHLSLSSGFHVSEYVAGVTVNPFIQPVIVTLISVGIAVLVVLIRLYGITPVQLLQNYAPKKIYKRQGNSSIKNWNRLLNRRLVFHDSFVMITMMLVMGAALFGYTYFSALTEKSNAGYQSQIDQNGLGNYDYVAKTSVDRIFFQIENHHEYGIPAEVIQELREKDYIEIVNAQIINRSTRLSYEKGTESEAMLTLLNPTKIRQYEASDDEYENTLYQGELAMMEEIGYKENEELYGVSTVGMSVFDIEYLKDFAVQGTIDTDKIASGQEVILAVPQEQADIVLQAFTVGDVLPLSDVVMDSEEDASDLMNLIVTNMKEPVFLREVEDPSGEVVPYKAYAFGKRHNIDTRIGAIVVLHEQEDYEKYLVSVEETMQGNLGNTDNYGMTLICTEDSYRAWELPDCNYNEVSIIIKDNADIYMVDEEVYPMLVSGDSVEVSSLIEIREKMLWQSNKVMIIFFILICMLILVGSVTIAMNLYARIRLNGNQLACLSCIGMSSSQMIRLIILQNLYYPFLGALFSILPVAICQYWFLSIRKQVEMGTLDLVEPEKLLRFMEIPYWYDLFSYHFAVLLVLLLLLGILLILLGTVPQIIYIKKLNAVQELEVNSY